MKKCVFIRYPEGVKGWKFLVPATQHTIISECADFYEREFIYKHHEQDRMNPQKPISLLEHDEDINHSQQLKSGNH